MTPSLRTRFLSTVIFFVLIASAVFTMPARADSGSPPPAPTAPGGSTHSQAQVPSGAANTAGGGDQGHKVELSNQNAAYIAPAGDPIWCPSGVAVPVPGAGGCSANYANLYSLTNAVETLAIHPLLTNSNIWIQHGADSSINQPILDGSVLTSLSNFSLNFKGGWNGLGTGSVNQAAPSTFTQGLRILNWNNNITLSDVQFSNVLTGTQEGIYITTKGNISLTRVQGNNNPGYGAYLDNTSGAGTVSIINGQFNGDAIPKDDSLVVHSNNTITLINVTENNGWRTIIDNSTGSNKAVTIKSSSFDNNLINGLQVISKGAIALSNVSASGNSGFAYGANLDNHNSLTAAPVTLTGMNTFDSNGNYGLFVYSKGKVTSGSISASKNGGFGFDIDNSTALSPMPVSLTGNSTFNGNGLDGLIIQSLGAITTNNLTANDNLTGDGAYLQNNFNLASPSPVKVTGTNEFSGNHKSGLYIVSNGQISLNNITANGNGTTGADAGLWAENRTAGSTTPQKIALTGINKFNLNTNGLVLEATGAISVSNLSEFGNSLTGTWIDNKWLGNTMPQPVTLLGQNTLIHSGNDNLNISTFGAITINNLTSNDSVAGKGAYLGFLVSASKVTLIGLNTFNHNFSDGLRIDTLGTILINNLNANANGGNGAVIDNSGSSTFSPVTLTGVSTFNFNINNGLEIFSKGANLTNGLIAISNKASGVIIQNSSATTLAPVTLKGINTFNNNGNGLMISAYGTVLASNLSANTNANDGVSIDNHLSTPSHPVILNGLSTFSNNSSYGLYIRSMGAVLTNGLSAVNNGSDGAFIANNYLGTSAPVTLKGVNTFNHNISSGLDIFSYGAVLTTGLNAVSNLSDGVNIDNLGSSLSSPVTLMGPGIFNLNGSDGLYITSLGSVLTNGLTALTNASDGVYINNSTSPSSAPVTLKGINTFNSNASDGVYIGSMGAVVTSGLTAINNASDGVFIDNSFSTTAPVTLMGLSTFNFNHSDGLFVVSRGTVTSNNLVAMNNASYGVYIDNSGSTIKAPVTLKGLGKFNNNGSSGLDIFSRGAVLTSSLSALNNGGWGAFIDNGGSSTHASITLGGMNTFSGNGGLGLELDSMGVITTNNLTASYNGAFGALMDNATGGPIEGINVKGKNVFFDNSNAGLAITSLGSVKMTNVSSKLNHNNGLSVNTPGNVIVSCGSFISNGMGHITGYGWETGSGVLHITLIGVSSFGNFSGDTRTDSGATVVTNIAHPCVLP